MQNGQFFQNSNFAPTSNPKNIFMDSNSAEDRNEQQENQISSTIPLNIDKSNLDSNSQMSGLVFTNQIPQADEYSADNKKKRKFTVEEDEKLRELVQAHGQKQWDLIARNLGADRTARQCRDRWKHYLSPNVSHVEWTLEEDSKLLKYIQTFGAQWAALVKFFPGRTDINLKNHWNKLQRKAKKLALLNPNIQIPKFPLTPEPLQLLTSQIQNYQIQPPPSNQPPPDQADVAQVQNGISYPLLTNIHTENIEKAKSDINENGNAAAESIQMAYEDSNGAGTGTNQ